MITEISFIITTLLAFIILPWINNEHRKKELEIIALVLGIFLFISGLVFINLTGTYYKKVPCEEWIKEFVSGDCTNLILTSSFGSEIGVIGIWAFLMGILFIYLWFSRIFFLKTDNLNYKRKSKKIHFKFLEDRIFDIVFFNIINFLMLPLKKIYFKFGKDRMMKYLKIFDIVFFNIINFSILMIPLICYILIIYKYGINYIWLFPIIALLTIMIDYTIYFDDYKSPLRFILRKIIKIFKK